MKNLLAVALVLLAVSPAVCRPVLILPYDQLLRQADLVVIATPTSVRDTQVETTFPGIQCDGKPVPAIRMEAEFDVLAVLKGDGAAKTFVLHYLRSDESRAKPAANGPNLIWFNPSEKHRYLLFLKRDENGGYSTLGIQTDSYFSVKDLGPIP
jgi:hypothetical protein